MRGIDLSYFVRRIIMFFLVIFVAASFNFLIPRLAPGNPIGAITSRMSQASAGIENGQAMFEAYRERFGLDDPMYVQYVKYLWNTIRFDFGYSLSAYPAERMGDHPAGHRLVHRPDRRQCAHYLRAGRHCGRAAGVEGHAQNGPGLPSSGHDLARVALLPAGTAALLCVRLYHGLFPMSGAYNSGIPKEFSWPFISSVAHHAVLPALSIILTSLGLWALTMRGLMVNTIGEDYMMLAEAKGLPQTAHPLVVLLCATRFRRR